MASVFITGCSRGIGLEFVKQLLAQPNPPAILIATCRNPEGAKALQALKTDHKNLHIFKVDIINLGNLPEVVQKVEALVGDKGLNILINNAGIHRGRKDAFHLIDETDMIDIFRTNCVGPLMVTKALLPLLKRAADVNKDKPIGFSRAAIISMSSMLGSFGSNTFGGWFEYRESKAALNMAVFSLAMELEKTKAGIIALVIHPGRVKTDMSSPEATLDVGDSVGSMLRVFRSLGPEHHGKLLQWEGQIMPW